ncbi:hypothetical protein ACEWPL_013995 [Roseovarius sp. S1116L3]|uniref:hypothetical protein n=1 Tax=Roseovarius roseus TaxID=3342636 RepID=UPI0037266C14
MNHPSNKADTHFCTVLRRALPALLLGQALTAKDRRYRQASLSTLQKIASEKRTKTKINHVLFAALC